jgi:pimeloyl-ACP methyl ester carboxylesterase
MPNLKIQDADLYFERRGAGRRLLFLNGSGATIESSELLIGVFAAAFDLVVSDYRGLGRSSPSRRPYGMSECAADALAVMDAVGWATAAVIGVSFGGMVAQELAVSAPRRVERLALLCTSSGGEGGSSYPLHELAGLTDTERSRVGSQLLDTRFDDAWLASHPRDRSLVAMMADRSRVPDIEQQRGRQEQLEARRTHDVWDRLPSIVCPTFVACGRYDGIAPAGNSEAIASRIAGAELHTYEGGHAFLAQDPDSIPAVISFLTETGTPPPS